MTDAEVRVLKDTFSPTAAGVAQTTALFTVHKGERVVWASARKDTLAAGSTTSTLSLGDGADVDGYIAVTDTETGSVGTLVPGEGAYLATSGGKLYLADDTIDIDYIPGATPGVVAPKWSIRVGLIREWPT